MPFFVPLFVPSAVDYFVVLASFKINPRNIYEKHDICLILVACAPCLAFAADAKVEAAKEKFEKKNKLNADYNADVDKAKSALVKVYDKQIKTLRKKDQQAKADKLAAEMEAYLAEMVAKKSVKPVANVALVEAIGEELYTADEKKHQPVKCLVRSPMCSCILPTGADHAVNLRRPWWTFTIPAVAVRILNSFL